MTLSGKPVLVTGATGFLGGALALRLAAEGARVRALARSPQKAEFLRSRNSSVEVVYGDVTEPVSLRAAMEGCAVVFHTAVSYGNYETQRRVNADGTAQVANAAADAGVTRLVHVSSIAVYGYELTGDTTEAMPVAADSDDPYLLTKVEAERVVREIGEKRHLPHTIIRPGMIYGPRSGMWTATTFRLARLKPTPWVGSNSGSVHPIFVDDVVDMMLVLAEHPAASGEVFNCTPDPSCTWREFIGAYQRLAGHQRWLALPYAPFRIAVKLLSSIAPPRTQIKALPDFLRLSQQRLTHRMDKARALLGWQPKVELESGVERCAPWLRDMRLLQ